jgi:hypothetical protein
MAAKTYNVVRKVDNANAIKIGMYGHVMQERPVPAYAFPGKYVIAYIGNDSNDTYCADCVNETLNEDISETFSSDLTFTADVIEEGSIMYCAQCNCVIYEGDEDDDA